MKRTRKDIAEKKARNQEKTWGWGNHFNAGTKKQWQHYYNAKNRRIPAYSIVISEEIDEPLNEDEMPITRFILVAIENRPRHHRGDINYWHG